MKKEIAAIKKKYEGLFEVIYEKRAEIVSGKREPNPEEVSAVAFDDEDECCKVNEVEDVSEESSATKDKQTNAAEDETSTPSVKGIPAFWLSALKNCSALSALIEDADEDALSCLVDVRCVALKESDFSEEERKEHANLSGYKIQFFFTPNEWFSDEILEKSFIFDCSSTQMPTDQTVEDFSEDSFLYAKGCTVNWKTGKSLVQKTVMKSQRNKKTGATRSMPESVPCNSFFVFFDTIDIPAEADYDHLDDEEASELEQELYHEFYLGETIKNRLIPYAFDWFVGAAHLLDEEDGYDEEGEYDEDYDGSDGSSQEDEDEDDGDAKQAPKTAAKAPECKNQ